MAKSKEEIENGYYLRIGIDINILVEMSQTNKHTHAHAHEQEKGRKTHFRTHKVKISSADKLAFDVGQKVMQIGFFRACLQDEQRGKNFNCPRK